MGNNGDRASLLTFSQSRCLIRACHVPHALSLSAFLITSGGITGKMVFLPRPIARCISTGWLSMPRAISYAFGRIA